MIKEMHITIPSRDGVLQASIFTKVFTQDNTTLINRDVVILIPGGPGNDCNMYDTPENSIAKTFLAEVNVILFDPRGCGKSEVSRTGYCSLDHYIDDIEALRIYFEIPAEKFIVFGQSYGSIAAVGYAIKYPDSLKKLLLIGGAASSEFLTEAKQELEIIGTSAQKHFAEKIWNGAFNGSQNEIADYYKVMSPLYSYSFVAKEDPPLEIPCNIDILNYGFGKFLKNFDFRPRLHKIKCQTLILWGENEWIMNRNQVRQLHQGIPHSKLSIYECCSHMLWIDQWDKFTKDALDFLR